MNSWIDLPNEILNNIFQRLSGTEVKQCSLTCRAWVFYAQRTLFQSISIMSDDHLKCFSDALSVYKHNSVLVSNKLSPAYFVKDVELTKLKYNSIVTLDLDLLENLFPFLEKLESHRLGYTMYNRLYSLMMDGRFSNIKKVNFAEWNEAHAELLLSREKNIEELLVADSISDNNLTFKIFHELHHFSKLEKLVLHCKNDHTAVNLDELLLKSPSTLRSIKLKMGILCVNSSLFDVNETQPWESVRKLTIINHSQLLPGDDKFLIYIMNKFPYLNELRIPFKKIQNYYPRDYTTPTESCLTQFLKYALNMKECCVHPIRVDNSTVDVIKSITGHFVSQKSMVFVLKISFDTRYTFEASDPKQYIGASKECYRDRTFITLNIVYNMSLMNSYRRLCEEIGHLKFDYLTIGDGASLLEDKITIELDVITYHFKNLTRIHLRNIYNVLFRDNDGRINYILEHLRLEKCLLTEEMLTCISKRCPHLKLLEFNACTFINPGFTHEDRDANQIITITMPNNCLQELLFTVALKDYYLNDIENICIKLHTDQRKPRYCKIGTVCLPEEIPTIVMLTEAEYEKCLIKERNTVYDIYCPSIKTMVVNYQRKNMSDIDPLDVEKLYLREEDLS